MRFYTNVHTSGNFVYVREVDNGKRKNHKVEYNPTLYVRSKNSVSKSGFYTLNKEPVEPIQFGSMKEARDFIRQNEEVSNFEVFGNTMFQYPFIAETYPEHDLPFDMSMISIGTVDIETESEDGFSQDAAQTVDERVNVITIKDFRHDVYHVFTFKDGDIYTDENYFTPKSTNVKHYSFDSEEEMFLGFIKVWRKLAFDIVTGWNVKFFDLTYLINRITRVLSKETAAKLSPWNMVQAEKATLMGREYDCYNIIGISTLDYLQLYRKNVLEPRESYKLDFIAKEELGVGKLDWREKYETMKEFYTKDFQMFVEYNIQDVKLPDMLEAKLKLIELIISVAYLAKCNFSDVLAQVRTWDVLIFNWLIQEKIVIPQKEMKEKNEQFTGAFVKDPKPGMYNNVVSFDVTSLYPSIIRALNIGPETKCEMEKDIFSVEDALENKPNFSHFAEQARDNDYTLAINGVKYWKKNLSFYSRMVETLFNNRKKYQGEMKAAKRELETCTDDARKAELKNIISKFDVKQKSTKVMMNSLYGAFGNQFFRFFDIDNAEAVTMTGQFIIQFIERGLNRYFNRLFKTQNIDYVIYCDTDSVYINLEQLVNRYKDKLTDDDKVTEFLDKVCKDKLEPEIDRLFAELTTDYINGMTPEKPILSMKREVIAKRGIWTGKKHYILSVQDSEGTKYKPSKLKIMGFEMIKSSMPAFSRKSMKEAVNIILEGTEDQFIDFVAQTRKQFMSLPVEEISCPRGVHGLEKYTDKENIFIGGTPLHTKAVLLYNHYVSEKGLQAKYPYIAEADKIKFVYLKVPNPIREKAIAFPSTLPPEFGLVKYIDKVAMFDLTFIDPITKIIDPIGWDIEKKFDMDKFFK